MEAGEVLRFSFDELAPDDWWRKNEALDAQIRERFWALHARASKMELGRKPPAKVAAFIRYLKQEMQGY